VRAAPPDELRGPWCPTCKMRLWESPIPRRLRTYDLRHTHGTLLRKAGVDDGAVSMGLGHSSPEITAGIYDHSGVQDFREDIEAALTFVGRGKSMHPRCRIPKAGKKKATTRQFPVRCRGLPSRGDRT